MPLSIQRFNHDGRAIVEGNLNAYLLSATDPLPALEKHNLLQQIKDAGNEWFTEIKLLTYLNKRRRDFEATRSNRKSYMPLSLTGPHTLVEEEEAFFGQISEKTRNHLKWLYQVLDKEDHYHLEYWTCEKEYAVTLQEINAYFAYLKKSGVTVYQGLNRDARSKLQGLFRGVPSADQRMYKRWAKRIEVDEKAAIEYIMHLKRVMGVGRKDEDQRNILPSSASEQSNRGIALTVSSPSLSPRSSKHEAVTPVADPRRTFASPPLSLSSQTSEAAVAKRKYEGSPGANDVAKRPRPLEQPVVQPQAHSLPVSVPITDPAPSLPRSSSSQPSPLTIGVRGSRLSPASEAVQEARTSPEPEPQINSLPILPPPPPPSWTSTPAVPAPAPAPTPGPSPRYDIDSRSSAEAALVPKTSAVQSPPCTRDTTPTSQTLPPGPKPSVPTQVDQTPNRELSPTGSPHKPPHQAKPKLPALPRNPFSLFGNHPLRGRTARHEHPVRIALARVRKEEPEVVHTAPSPPPVAQVSQDHVDKDEAEETHGEAPAPLVAETPAVAPAAPPEPTKDKTPPVAVVGEETKIASDDSDDPIEDCIVVCNTIPAAKPAVKPRSGQKESKGKEPARNSSPTPSLASKSPSKHEVNETPPIATIEQEGIEMKAESDEDVYDDEELMYPADEGSEYQPSDVDVDELDSDSD